MPENQKKSILQDPLQTQSENSTAGGIIFFMLCLILIYSALAFGAVDKASLGLLSIFTGVIAIFWLIDAWRNKEFSFNTNLLQVPIFGLIIIGLVQLLPFRSPTDISLAVAPTSSLSLAPYETRLAIIQLIVYFIFFAAALTFFNNHKRLRKLVLMIIIFASLMAFYGIIQRLASPDLIYNYRPIGQSSPFASFFNQHHFAAFMEMTIGLPLALLFGKATDSDKRYLLIIAAALMGMAIIFTSSRGGFLSLLGVLGFIIIANLLNKPKSEKNYSDNRFGRKFVFIGGGLALILVLFGTVFLLGGDNALVRTLTLQSTTEDISNGRLHFWSIALQNFANYPILGSGLNSYGMIFPQYDTWNGILRVEHTHNDYLQILSDAGILGFSCVVGFIYLLFRKSLRVIGETENIFRRSVAIGALAGCFGILIHSFFDFPLRTPSNSFFFLTMATLATVSVYYPQSHRQKQ